MPGPPRARTACRGRVFPGRTRARRSLPSDFRCAACCGTTTGVAAPVAVASCGRLAPLAAADRDEAAEGADRGQVDCVDRLEVDGEPELVLDPRDQLEQPERVDQPLAEQVEVVRERRSPRARRPPAASRRARRIAARTSSAVTVTRGPRRASGSVRCGRTCRSTFSGMRGHRHDLPRNHVVRQPLRHPRAGRGDVDARRADERRRCRRRRWRCAASRPRSPRRARTPRAATSSTSPSSTRCPPILTWLSTRPR